MPTPTPSPTPTKSTTPTPATSTASYRESSNKNNTQALEGATIAIIIVLATVTPLSVLRERKKLQSYNAGNSH